MKAQQVTIKPVSIIGDGTISGPRLNFVVRVKPEQSKRVK
jgi:hypothetical protein